MPIQFNQHIDLKPSFMKSCKFLFTTLIVSQLLLSCNKDEIATASLKLDLESAANGVSQNQTAEFVPGEVLVKFKSGKSNTGKAKALGLLKGSMKEHIHTEMMKKSGDNDGLFLISVNEDVFAAVSKAKGLTEVEYAEPNWIYKHQAVSNDPYFTQNSLWGMYGSTSSPSNTFGSGAAVAWANGKTASEQVYVGIIDEGYQYTHLDLAANVGVNTKEIAGNRKDDDRNGFVDDIYGWDFAGNNNSVYDGSSSRPGIDAHGTHVAGTIGGVGDNGIGVVGVCRNVRFISAKFLGSTGGTTANAVRAVDYITSLKKAGLNFVATNNSWGGGGYSQALLDAINRANTAEILFIAAAGNNKTDIDGSPSYPASYKVPNIISVAAINSTGGLASFSNYGAKSVHLGAPGEGIMSTVPFNKYAIYSGTSMATPHVTGAAALYKSFNPGATALQIRDAILFSVEPTESLSDKTIKGGRLNVSGF